MLSEKILLFFKNISEKLEIMKVSLILLSLVALQSQSGEAMYRWYESGEDAVYVPPTGRRQVTPAHQRVPAPQFLDLNPNDPNDSSDHSSSDAGDEQLAPGQYPWEKSAPGLANPLANNPIAAQVAASSVAAAAPPGQYSWERETSREGSGYVNPLANTPIAAQMAAAQAPGQYPWEIAQAATEPALYPWETVKQRKSSEGAGLFNPLANSAIAAQMAQTPERYSWESKQQRNSGERTGLFNPLANSAIAAQVASGNAPGQYPREVSRDNSGSSGLKNPFAVTAPSGSVSESSQPERRKSSFFRKLLGRKSKTSSQTSGGQVSNPFARRDSETPSVTQSQTPPVNPFATAPVAEESALDSFSSSASSLMTRLKGTKDSVTHAFKPQRKTNNDESYTVPEEPEEVYQRPPTRMNRNSASASTPLEEAFGKWNTWAI